MAGSAPSGVNSKRKFTTIGKGLKNQANNNNKCPKPRLKTNSPTETTEIRY